MQRFLIIQTAFIGDVVLATALVEKLKAHYPEAQIDFFLRKGNEHLLSNHPSVNCLYIWDKGKGKLMNLLRLAAKVRSARYDVVVNVHRHGTSGLVTLLSGARQRRGFSQNPFSWSYSHKVAHRFSRPADKELLHEVARNQALIADFTDESPARPRLHPSEADWQSIRHLQGEQYICIAPSSVWATKRFPTVRWAELIDRLPRHVTIYLLGASSDKDIAEEVLALTAHPKVTDLTGSLSIMQSAALMAGALMNYANDSGPVHFASAVNAPITAVFCSTHRCFGFGPLSDNSRVVELDDLYCKPCGIHGYNACPQGHFRCANDIDINQLLWWITPQISEPA